MTACESAGIEPAIAIKRDEHHPHWSERFESPQAPPAGATPVTRIAHPLKTPKGLRTTPCASKPSSRCARHHQIRDGVSSVPHPRSGQCSERVDPGGPGVELKAHGRMTPAVRHKGDENLAFRPRTSLLRNKWPRGSDAGTTSVKPERLLAELSIAQTGVVCLSRHSPDQQSTYRRWAEGRCVVRPADIVGSSGANDCNRAPIEEW